MALEWQLLVAVHAVSFLRLTGNAAPPKAVEAVEELQSLERLARSSRVYVDNWEPR
jgi:hypothetical protein